MRQSTSTVEHDTRRRVSSKHDLERSKMVDCQMKHGEGVITLYILRLERSQDAERRTEMLMLRPLMKYPARLGVLTAFTSGAGREV